MISKKYYAEFTQELIDDFRSGKQSLPSFTIALERVLDSLEEAHSPEAEEFSEIWQDIEILNAVQLADKEQGLARDAAADDRVIIHYIEILEELLKKFMDDGDVDFVESADDNLKS